MRSPKDWIHSGDFHWSSSSWGALIGLRVRTGRERYTLRWAVDPGDEHGKCTKNYYAADTEYLITEEMGERARSKRERLARCAEATALV